MSDQSIPPVQPQVSSPPVSDDRTQVAVAPSLVQGIAQSTVVAASQPQMGGSGKEKGSISSETVPIIEVGNTGALEKEPLPAEVESWMEKVGQEEAQIKLENLPPVQVPPPAPATSTPAQPIFVLPLGEQEMQLGLHSSINDSIRWLATWAKRVMKQFKGQVAYRDNS